MSSNININSSLLLYNGMSILYACISAGEYDAPGFLNFSNNLEIFIKSGLAGHLKLLDLCTMCYPLVGEIDPRVDLRDLFL